MRAICDSIIHRRQLTSPAHSVRHRVWNVVGVVAVTQCIMASMRKRKGKRSASVLNRIHCSSNNIHFVVGDRFDYYPTLHEAACAGNVKFDLFIIFSLDYPILCCFAFVSSELVCTRVFSKQSEMKDF